MKILARVIAMAAPLLCGAHALSARAGEAASGQTIAQSHFAQFGTNRIHYVVEGKGRPALVLVHCWAGNAGFWHDQVPALADKARLLLIDLPGHGESDKPHTAYTMDFFAQAVLAVMRDAHVSKATLIGHSMGVPIICRVYKQAPEQVAALVAVDGILRRPKMTAEQAEQFMARFRGANYREQTTNLVASMFPSPGTEPVRDRVLSEMLQTPQFVMASAMEGMFSPDQPDWDLHHVDVPVLVINAPNPMWNQAYQDYIHALSPQTDYRVIEGTGHWLMLEKPAEFNAALVETLGKFGLIEK
jgi:pimeloyl-ACP methyl ester carboxylesterase